MPSMNLIVTTLWVVVTVLYLALFLYRSLIGMKEEDSLFLSAGESRIAAEQHEVMKKITKLDGYSNKLGWATIAMTIVLAGVWGYDAVKQLF